MFEEFEMFKKLLLRSILLPEPAVPELVEGSKGRCAYLIKKYYRSLSLDSPEPVEGSKGDGSRLTLQTI